jgi:hypothetical protein
MAIIYSYPLADEVTNDSWVLGSEMENGQRVVKNYSVGDIVSFTRGFVTLNDVLDNNNVSEIDAKIGELYLYDVADGDYGKIRLNDSIFRLIGSNGSDVLYAEGPLLVVGNMRLDGDNLTVPRFFTLPNKDGTFALISDLVTGYVPYTGATGNVNLGEHDIYTSGGARLGDDGTVWGTSFQFTNEDSSLQAGVTAARAWILPDESGTVALTLDLPQIADNFANDAAAEFGGIDLGGLYHTDGVVKIRID